MKIVQDVFTEHSNILLLKEISKNLKGKNITLIYWNIQYCQDINSLHTVSTQRQFLCRNVQINLKFCMEIKNTQNIQGIERKREKECVCMRKGGREGDRIKYRIKLKDLYYLVSKFIIKILQVEQQNWYQIRNTVESKEISSHVYSQSSIIDKKPMR